MSDYMIVTDNMCDLPDDYCEKHALERVYLSYLMDGVTYNGDKRQDEKEFYARLRKGALPVTSQITPDVANTALTSLIKAGNKDILFIAFSSGLSGTFNSVSVAAKELMEEYPDCRIKVLDSLCASMGQGLLVHKALCMQEKGASFEEVAEWVENNKLHLVHNFTVDDLFHLHRGGRVSRATAIVGSVINIKPMLHVDDAGHLISIGKVRGRRKSIVELANAMEKQMGSRREENDTVFISHGDCLEDARFLADLIKERFGIKDILINYVGPTIGAHSGPGTLALFYLGDYR